ncbi:hypothetical protein KKF34_05645, partial [Myxococcota bacterium]|nr:hypothetical protein [Myxococcota bacterium]
VNVCEPRCRFFFRCLFVGSTDCIQNRVIPFFHDPRIQGRSRIHGWRHSRLCDYPGAVPALTSRADKLAPVQAQAHDPRIQVLGLFAAGAV